MHNGRFIACLIVSTQLSSCSFFGERLRIDTEKPIDDFLVKCIETHSYLIGHNASGKMVTDGTFITKSGEEVSCGINLYGHDSHTYVSHPTYKYNTQFHNKSEKRYTENGAIIKEYIHWKEKNNKAIKLYEEGYWGNKYKYKTYNPAKEFIKYISYCSISNKYLEEYSKDSTLNYLEFKNKYYDEILECNRENERIMHKYNLSNDAFYYAKRGKNGARLEQCTSYNRHCKKSRVYLPDKTITARNERMWGYQRWSPYLKGSKEEINRLFNNKETFLVVYNHPEGGGVWFLMDAYSKEHISNKYPEFEPLDKRPQWMSEQRKKTIVRDCNNKDLHWDIDEPISGWLLIHEKNNLARPCEKTKYIHINQGVIR